MLFKCFLIDLKRLGRGYKVTACNNPQSKKKTTIMSLMKQHLTNQILLNLLFY